MTNLGILLQIPDDIKNRDYSKVERMHTEHQYVLAKLFGVNIIVVSRMSKKNKYGEPSISLTMVTPHCMEDRVSCTYGQINIEERLPLIPGVEREARQGPESPSYQAGEDHAE